MVRTRTMYLLAALVAALASGLSLAQEAGKDSPAEAIRKGLDQTVTIDFTCQSLQEAIQHLREKTKLNLVVDVFTLQQMGFLLDDGNPNPPQIHLKLDKGKARQALQRALQPYNLTYAIVGDAVLITTEEMGVQRQMRQRINVDVSQVALDAALKNLARTHAISLVIDPKVAKVAQQELVALQLDDATLETTVRLLAEMAGLKSVRVGNVLFVTDERKAEKLRQEENVNAPFDPRFPRFGANVVQGFGGFGGLMPFGGGGIGGGIGAPPIARPDRPVAPPPPGGLPPGAVPPGGAPPRPRIDPAVPPPLPLKK